MGGGGPVVVNVNVSAAVNNEVDLNALAWRVSEVVAQRVKALR